jgi:dihydrofolate reductase
MRKIIITEYISLDGIFEEPGHWSFDFWNDEAMAYKHNELFSSDALLLGRLTYDGFAKAWPTMEGTGDFGERMNSIPKYVISTTLQQADWNNTTIIKNNVVEEIKKLKEQDGQDILVAGSGQLVQTLLENNLADEIRFLLHPVILGSGKKLFRDDVKKTLQLTESKSFKTGIVVLHYKIK